MTSGEPPWEIAHEQAPHQQEAEQAEGSTENVARKIAETAGTTLCNDHLQHWAAHAVYGATLELSRNLIRRLL